MVVTDEIYSLVVGAVNEVQKQAGKNPIAISRSTELLGDRAILDSVSFVILIVELERVLPASYQVVKNLTEHEAILDPLGPFRTVGTLCDHLLMLSDTNAKHRSQ